MMICPACNYELLLHNDYCENCGAPAYLVTASQTADVTHCTYCGARDESGKGDCATCGLKKNFKTSASLIGTCRNCGVAWRSVWMYCQTCGVARENGLVDTTLPMTVHLHSHSHTVSPSGRGFQFAHSPKPPLAQYEVAPNARDLFLDYADFNSTVEPEMEPLLSENEVVERMYANGDEDTAQRKNDLDDFFSESEIADSRRPTTAHQNIPAEKRAIAHAAVIYDLAVPVNRDPVAPSTQPHPARVTPLCEPKRHLDGNGTLTPFAPADKSPLVEPLVSDLDETSAPEAPALVTIPTPNPNAETQTQGQVKTEATSAEAAATAVTKPVQTVRVIHHSRTPKPPPIDTKLVKIIAVLIFLVLLFSALIVSDFRLRDLFGKPQPQASPSAEVKPSAAPTQTEARPAPEGMVQVPDGTFRMGRDDGDEYEAPAHDVKIASFFMDRTEVTNAQYAAFLTATKHAAPLDWKDGKYAAGTENFPVVNVSWPEANDYATWAGKRLPTEAEWEFAARAKDGRHYPWGSNWDATKANTSESNLNHPVAVGSYANAANPLGLLDMAGNVWEWTADDVLSYKDSSITLVPGKVIRGGAFYAPKERATTTFRGFAPPDKQAAGIGFRCVKNAI